MEKSISKINSITVEEHEFYCDMCNKFIGKSEEYPDGWYQTLGDFEVKCFVVDNWYKLKKCLCDECREKLIVRLKEDFVKIGFELE